MGSPVIDPQRKKLWWILSDAFVDNAVDFPAMARELKGFDAAVVEEVLFSEVAPVCHANLESVLPAVWLCFNREELEADITDMLRARDGSQVTRWWHRLWVRWLRYRYRYIWVEISKALLAGGAGTVPR